MTDIKELNYKYIVVKREDAKAYLKAIQQLETGKDYEQLFYRCLNFIGKGREKDKKPFSNHYVVLNLDDDIDLKYLRNRIHNALDRPMGSVWSFRVRDIAVDLVNAILKTKEQRGDSMIPEPRTETDIIAAINAVAEMKEYANKRLGVLYARLEAVRQEKTEAIA